MRFLKSILSLSALSAVSAIQYENPFFKFAPPPSMTNADIDVLFANVNHFFAQHAQPFSTEAFHSMDASATCLQAVGQLQALLATGCAGSGTVAPSTNGTTTAPSTMVPSTLTMAPGTNTTGTPASTGTPAASSATPTVSLPQALGTFCADTTCKTTVQAQLNTALTACNNPGSLSPTGQAAIGALVQYNNYLSYGCTKNGNNVCLPIFVGTALQLQAQAAAGGTTAPGAQTNAQLDAVCQPCNIQVAAALGSSPSATAADLQVSSSLNALCIKDPDTPANYCVQTVYKAQLASGPTVTAADFPGYYCSSCLQKLNAAQALIPGTTTIGPSAAAAFAAAVPSLCALGPSSAPCASLIPQLQADLGAAPTTLSSCLTAITAGAACPSACPAQIQGIVAKYGCCFGVLLKAAGSTPANAALLGPVNNVLSNCGLTSLLTPCGSVATQASVTLDIPNLLYSYYTANAATLKTTIQADIAAAAGALASQVTISSVAADSKTGTQVTAVISTASTVNNNDAATNINNLLTNNALALPMTAASISAAGGASTSQVTPGQGLVATSSSQATTQAAGSTPGGSTTAPPSGAPTTAGDASALSISVTGLLATVMAGLALLN